MNFFLARIVLALASCMLGFGCSSARVFQTSGSMGSVGTVSDVHVSIHPGSLDVDTESYYRTNSISGLLRTAVLAELRRKGKVDTNGAKIEISVTDFRLRSGSAVFWVGVMAGSDHIASVIVVKKGNISLKTFEASASGNESLWSALATGRLSTGSRANLFCQMIARNIASQL